MLTVSFRLRVLISELPTIERVTSLLQSFSLGQLLKDLAATPGFATFARQISEARLWNSFSVILSR